MTQIHWLNPISDSFTNASDWSGGVVPGATDSAILDAPGNTPYTITASNFETISSIQTSADATLAVTNDGYMGSFTASAGTGSGANAGVILVSNGAALAMGGMIDNSGSIVVAGGGRGTLLVFGTDNHYTVGGSATLTGGGDVTFLARAGLV